MKIIIAGSRTITNKNLVFATFFEGLTYFVNTGCKLPLGDTIIVSGHAKGVDKLGEDLAKLIGAKIVQMIPAWDIFGKKAGYIRNERMADYADALIAVWDGKSKGTKHMIDIAKKKGLKVFVYESC